MSVVDVVFHAHGEQVRALSAEVPPVGSLVRLLDEGAPLMVGIAGRSEWLYEGEVLVGVIVPLSEHVDDEHSSMHPQFRNELLKDYAEYRLSRPAKVVVHNNALGDFAPPGSVRKTRATATPMRVGPNHDRAVLDEVDLMAKRRARS